MSTTHGYKSAPTPPAFEPVINLSSGLVVGYDVRSRRQTAAMLPYQAGEMVEYALVARGDVSEGEFLSVRFSPWAVTSVREQLAAAGPLDRLAMILIGDTGPDALPVMRHAREHGALVGCDGAAALL